MMKRKEVSSPDVVTQRQLAQDKSSRGYAEKNSRKRMIVVT
jgi:hypothetical protein